jgi:hypothetical protein
MFLPLGDPPITLHLGKWVISTPIQHLKQKILMEELTIIFIHNVRVYLIDYIFSIIN